MIVIFGIYLVLPDDMWTPFKHLNKLVDSHLHGHVSDTSALEAGLRKYKQIFGNVLKNSVRLIIENV